MSLVAFKLTVPPLLILVASLVGRRWGEAVGGWLVGLPLTSGPIAVFLAVQYGAGFAAQATSGSLVGTAAQACFSLGYALAASRGWGAGLAAGTLAYALCGAGLQGLALPQWGFFAIAAAALTGAAWAMPRGGAMGVTSAPPWWDLPARMAVVALLVVSLTAAAAVVGARVAGVLASFPVFGTILAVFAHRMRGAATAVQVLRGMVLSLYGFAVFFFVLGELLGRVGLVAAFAASAVAALAVQGVALRVIRRG